MITSLEIKNFILIDEIKINFPKGLSIITGESGTGKSIILDALGFVLGSRLGTDVLRDKQNSVSIVADFDISSYPSLIEMMKEKDIYIGNKMTFKRVIGVDKKSKSFINDIPTPLATIKRIGELIMRIYTQSSHTDLQSSDRQSEIFDTYCGLSIEILNLGRIIRQHQEVRQEIDALSELLNDDSKIPYLEHQIAELSQYNLDADYLVERKQEYELLQNSVENITHLSGAKTAISGEGFENILDLLSRAKAELRQVKLSPDALENVNEELVAVEDSLDRLELAVDRVIDLSEFDEEKFSYLDEMFYKLDDIIRKHHTSLEDLGQLYVRLQKNLDNIKNGEENLARLKESEMSLLISYDKLARKISEVRKSKQTEFCKRINANMSSLNMKGLEFSVQFSPTDGIHKNGLELVEFFTNNIGFEPTPLRKSASGGELSRISLCIETLIANTHSVATIVFDEVDVGISGASLVAVADFFTSMKEKTQLICITHQAVVAQRADTHFLIEKEIRDQKAQLVITQLDEAGRNVAIASLLG